MNYHYLSRWRARTWLVVLLFFCVLSTSWSQQLEGVEPGVFRVKLTEEMASRLENAKFSRSSDNALLTGITQLDNLATLYHATTMTRVFPDAGKYEAKHRAYGLHLWYTITVDESMPLEEVLQSYRQQSAISLVEPVHTKVSIDQGEYIPVEIPSVVKKQTMNSLSWPTNDPLLPRQWHYHNTGQASGTEGADIGLKDAWNVHTGSPDVIIAVTDGGIDVDHEDIADNMWINTGEIPDNGIDDDNNGYVDDINGYSFVDGTGTIEANNHGTHVGGTVAAVSNNGIGVAGVAGGSGDGVSGARLMSCAVFSSAGNGGFAQTYVYAADNGAVISQNSWTYSIPNVYDQAVLDGIDYFIAEAGKDEMGNQIGPMFGGIVIFAAANYNSSATYYPASYDPILSVASTSNTDTKSYFSNYGTWVDISAPGGETNVVSGRGVLSSVIGGYAFYQGTSMACPHASGVAALMVSYYGGPGYTPDVLWARIESTTEPIDELNPNYQGLLGTGRINAYRALADDDGVEPEDITDLAVEVERYNAILLSWTTPVDLGDGVMRRYDIRYSLDSITEATFDAAMKVLSDKPAPGVPGSIDSVWVKGLAVGTDYYFAMKTIDVFDNRSAISNVQKATTADGPDFLVASDSLDEILMPEETATHTIVLTNIGSEDIPFTASVSGTGRTGVTTASSFQSSQEPGNVGADAVTTAAWDLESSKALLGPTGAFVSTITPELSAGEALLATDFESFQLGIVSGQQGWSGNSPYTISDANPFSGAQHIRGLSHGLGTAGLWSPMITLGDAEESTMIASVNVELGVLWQFIVQSPSAGYVVTRIQFAGDGSVQALTNNDGIVEMVNIADSYPSGYFYLGLEVIKESNEFSIYFDHKKIFTGTGFSADIEQVVLYSTMASAGPTMDVDDLQILNGAYETLPPFLTVTPTDGVVGPNSSVALSVTFDPAEVGYGTFVSKVLIETEYEKFSIPAVMTVTDNPDPDVDVDPSVLQVEVPYAGDSATSFTITNTGGAPLTYSLDLIGPGLDLATRLEQKPVNKYADTEMDAATAAKLQKDIENSPEVVRDLDAVLTAYVGTVLFEEDFESESFPPEGWITNDLEGSGLVWAFDEYYGEGNYTGGSGKSAVASSDAFGPAEFDTDLITPYISTDGLTNITIQYKVNYQNFAAFDFLDVEIQLEGESTWTTVLSWNEDHGGFRATPGEEVNIDITDDLGNASSFRIRWHYYDPNTGDYDWYANIDDVKVLGDPKQWLVAGPPTGTIPIGGSQEITAYFNAEDLDPGFYVGGILVATNSPSTPLAGVVASMEVLEPAIIEVSPEAVLDSLWVGETSEHTITVSNAGVSPLIFSVIGGQVILEPSTASQDARLEPMVTRTAPTPNTLRLDDIAAIPQEQPVPAPATVSYQYLTGFEDFTAGDVNGQDGWIGYYGNWTIDPFNPYEGIYHFRGLSDGYGQTVAFSPSVSPAGSEPISSTTMRLNLDEAVDVTWQVSPQSPAAGYVITRFLINADGSLQTLAQDSTGAVVYMDIPGHAPEGYFVLRIDVERATSIFTIYFDDTPVFTGQGFAGNIEQVVFISQGEVAGALFDIDNLAILDGEPFDPWYSISPTSGVVSAGGSMPLTLILDATKQEKGVYEDVLEFSSNDPETPVLEYPVTLVVDKNIPPALASVMDTTVVETTLTTLTFTATDEDDALVTVSVIDPPAFMTLASTSSGVATYEVDPEIGDAGAYKLSVLALDARGFTDTTSFKLTVIPYGVSGFTLVNTDTGETLAAFQDSVTIDVADPDFLKYAIRANTYPEEVGSVAFYLDGNKKAVELFTPYDLKPLFDKGTHTLEAIAYTNKFAKGDSAGTATAMVTITNSTAVTELMLVDEYGYPLTELSDRAYIDLASEGFDYFSLIVKADPDTKSVVFKLNGTKKREDNLAPFTMTDSWFGKYQKWELTPGSYELEVTPYLLPFALGVPGETMTVSFDVGSGSAKGSNEEARRGTETAWAEGAETLRDVVLSPVPVNNELNVQVSGELKGEALVTIFNLQGQVLYKQQMPAGGLRQLRLRLDEMGISKGMYYLHLAGEELLETKKFIKE